ncbi:MAG: hypothetical protein AAGB26_14630 [Planctomycetota bacterium]
MKTTVNKLALLLAAIFIFAGGLSALQTTSFAASHLSEREATPSSNADPTPRESKLLARIDELEASLAHERDLTANLKADLDEEKNNNKSLSAKLDQQLVTNARLSAALEVATRGSEAKSAQIEKQAELIQQQLEHIATVQEQRAELGDALIKERSEHRRAKVSVLRLTESLKACQAERDKLAAELADLRSKED